jgi:TonB-dependent starch-binding outer membrane protein SusC
MTKRIACTFLLCLLCLPFVSALANEGDKPYNNNRSNRAIPVSGVITDSKTAEPMPGVSVQVKGTTIGVTTDAEGRFKIEAPDSKSVLVFSFTGYSPQELVVGDQTSISISLESLSSNLNEVVVVGYGKQKKGDVTSSVASVKSEDFTKGFARDAGQLIQGKVAGLAVTTTSGDPNATTQISLRGNSTLASSTQPLVLIDGIPGSLNTVAPQDIESIDVLKDGSAAAIYGTRGTNGVVLITTRKKGARAATISYDGDVTVQKIARKMEFLDADDYRRLIDEGEFPASDDYGTSTDWLGEISRDPVSTTHQFTLQGGNGQTNYVASVNARKWQGFFNRSDNEQLVGRVDIQHVMFDNKLKFNVQAIARNRKNFSGPNYSYIYRQAIIRNPTDSVYNWLGKWKEDPNTYNYDNPVRPIEEVDGESRNSEVRLNGAITFTPIRNLNLKAMISSVKANGISGYAESFTHKASEINNRRGYASRASSLFREDLLEITADYSKSFGEHRFTALGGYSWLNTTSEGFNTWTSHFPTDLYSYNNLASGTAITSPQNDPVGMESNKGESLLISFFGRLNYAYKDKYLLMAVLRREGSTKFGANYKWGNFPALSVGWRISKEDFMAPVTFVNDLKLRAGYGVTGTAPGADYLALVSLRYSNSMYLYNGQWYQPIAPFRNSNPNLKWEVKHEYNFGLDFVLFNSKLSGSIDVYQRSTKDMIYDYPVPVPPNFVGATTANAGEMKNQGIELLLNYDVYHTKDFEVGANLTYSYNRNELVSINNDQYKLTRDWFTAGHTGEPIQVTTHRVKVGDPIGNFFGYKTIDIDEDGWWIIEGADGKPKSIDDATEDDRQVLGNGIPKHTAGLNLNFRYKRVDVTVNLRGAFGYQVLNYQRLYYENPTIGEYNMLKTAFDDVYGKTRLTYPLAYVSHYIEDGDHIKFDNIAVGYNINTGGSKYIRSARVYVAGLNMFMITKYKGIDPEVSRLGLDPGRDDRDKYPTMRTFTAGVNLTF